MAVSSCCGCCSVKAGVIIIGILHMLACGSFLILACIKASEYSFIISLSIQVALTILLLFGVQNRNVNYIFPFLCVIFTNITGTLPISFVQKIQLGVFMGAAAWYYILVISLALFFFALSVYFFMVVYSFYQELLHEKFNASFVSNN